MKNDIEREVGTKADDRNVMDRSPQLGLEVPRPSSNYKFQAFLENKQKKKKEFTPLAKTRFQGTKLIVKRRDDHTNVKFLKFIGFFFMNPCLFIF